jgi:hypothetical protein
VCVKVFKLKFRGINDSGHSKTPCPRMLPMSMGLPLAEHTRRWHGMRRRGRDSPQISSLTYNMRRDIQKEKLIVFMVGRKKDNE